MDVGRVLLFILAQIYFSRFSNGAPLEISRTYSPQLLDETLQLLGLQKEDAKIQAQRLGVMLIGIGDALDVDIDEDSGDEEDEYSDTTLDVNPSVTGQSVVKLQERSEDTDSDFDEE